jgi:hypothetical protein
MSRLRPARLNRRPIELGLPAIPDLRPLSRRVINATSTSLFHAPHSIFAKRLVCCADQLNPPRKAAVRRMSGYGMAASGAKRSSSGRSMLRVPMQLTAQGRSVWGDWAHRRRQILRQPNVVELRPSWRAARRPHAENAARLTAREGGRHQDRRDRLVDHRRGGRHRSLSSSA